MLLHAVSEERIGWHRLEIYIVRCTLGALSGFSHHAHIYVVMNGNFTEMVDLNTSTKCCTEWRDTSQKRGCLQKGTFATRQERWWFVSQFLTLLSMVWRSPASKPRHRSTIQWLQWSSKLRTCRRRHKPKGGGRAHTQAPTLETHWDSATGCQLLWGMSWQRYCHT